MHENAQSLPQAKLQQIYNEKKTHPTLIKEN
jgi:hypothetical protein